MKILNRVLVSIVLIVLLLSSALPCGPGYISPVFERSNAPENPYTDYASGRLGIVKPGFRRSLLFAAYRYISGGSFSPSEQQDLLELWKAEVDRDYEQQDDVSSAVKAWVEKRKDVVGKDEKTPDIYVERSYGGYDFFPNCAKNAFEVAAETLGSRIASYGASDQFVRNWLNAQDEVFSNCSKGKVTPADPPPGAPQWLQKDRAYQQAAAEFYSLDYNDAIRRFAEIAQDTESPWQETSDYLVARTLIRQASLTKDPEKAGAYYDEAEGQLQRFVSRTGAFADSAERLGNLVKYRRHPRERARELARTLTYQSGNTDLHQDLIDYTWLLDKFESEAMQAELMRKAREEWIKGGGESDAVLKSRVLANLAKIGVSVSVTVDAGIVRLEGQIERSRVAEAMAAANEAKPRRVDNLLTVVDPGPSPDPNKLEVNLYSDDFTQSWKIYVDPDATDDETIAEAERVVGKPLSKEMKDRVRAARQTAYSGRFSDNRGSGYEGGYWGEEDVPMSVIPQFLAMDDLTDWLYAYQIKGPEAYKYALTRYQQSGSLLWLMNALVKASPDSPDVQRLLDAAASVGRSSPAFETVTYHRARLLIESGHSTEARTLLDDILDGPGELSVSTRNSFLGLRVRVADTLDNFLRYSLRKPFAYDFDGFIGTVDDLIAEQKKYYDPEYNKDGREAYDREVEERYAQERLWNDRLMLDSQTIDLMNREFPMSLLIEVAHSPALPDYLRPKFTIAIWTRAYLAGDQATLLKTTPELAKQTPELAVQLKAITDVRSPAARDNAELYFVLKNPVLSPYIEDGMGKSDNEYGEWDANDWWCSSYLSYEEEYNEQSGNVLRRPGFVTDALAKTAAAERKQLIGLGDAPELLAKRVFEWAARYPTDRRVPEALYIIHAANGWNKYGCGDNEEIVEKAADLLKTRYPSNEWTRKMEEPPADAD